MMRVLIILLLTRHWDAQLKGNQMHRVCRMHSGDQNCVQKVAQKTLWEINSYKTWVLEGRII
jgi:hypothetical protein